MVTPQIDIEVLIKYFAEIISHLGQKAPIITGFTPEDIPELLRHRVIPAYAVLLSNQILFEFLFGYFQEKDKVVVVSLYDAHQTLMLQKMLPQSKRRKKICGANRRVPIRSGQ